jgi:hypothetical protein
VAKKGGSVTEALRKIVEALRKNQAPPERKKRVIDILDEIAEELKKQHP